MAAKKGLRIHKDVSVEVACDFFCVTRSGIGLWFKSGCPRNKDTSVNLYDVHKWLVDREKKKGLEDNDSLRQQKLKAEVEHLETKIAKLNDAYMERDEHHRVLMSLASSHQKFWESKINKEAHNFIMLPSVEDVRGKIWQWVKEQTAGWVSKL